MNRLLAWGIAGILIAGATGLMVVNAQQPQGPVFIAGDSPVSEDQVRTKLQTDGWSGVEIQREGRYFRVTASKDGQSNKIVVDALTGRLRADDDDDDD
jgi:hypothetical protein